MIARDRNALPVLMYHGVHADPTSRGVFHPIYSVGVDEFARQLDRLAADGFRPVRLAQWRETQWHDTQWHDTQWREVERPVVLTFDDGDVSNVEVVLPMLLERGLTAEFFVTSDFVGQPGMMTPDDVATLARSGMGVQSHGRTHRHLADLTDTALREELTSSRTALERWSGVAVEAVSLPGGRGGAREREVARALGYRWVLDSWPVANRRRDTARLHRVAVTRGTTGDQYAALVARRGLEPRRRLARAVALELPKRALGNRGYDVLRARLVGRRGVG